MLKAIEYATRQKIEPLAMPSLDDVANRRVAQFTQQIIDARNEQKLDFFFDMIRNIEETHGLSSREIAATLAWLQQRERPLQMETNRKPGTASTAVAPAPTYEPRSERFERVERGERSDHADRPAYGDRPPRENRPNRDEVLGKRRDFAAGKLAKYRIDVGRAIGVLPKEIVGAIANEGGIEGKYIGQIHLFDDYSTVELPADLSAEMLSNLERIRVRQVALKTRPAQPGEGDDTRPPRRSQSSGGPGSYGAPRDRDERPRSFDKPYEKKSFEKGSFEKKPFEKKPFEKKPFEKKPFGERSFDKKPFEKKSFSKPPRKS
jgi:ATP-dependent RNA helicase DeaD